MSKIHVFVPNLTDKGSKRPHLNGIEVAYNKGIKNTKSKFFWGGVHKCAWHNDNMYGVMEPSDPLTPEGGCGSMGV